MEDVGNSFALANLKPSQHLDLEQTKYLFVDTLSTDRKIIRR